MSVQDKSEVTEKPQELSDLDQMIQANDVAGMNAYMEDEAKKQGIDLTKPRDEKGRFVSTKQEVKETQADPTEPITYKMTVEVAPGHSIEVSADSEEACKLKADLAMKVAETALAAAKPKQEVKQDIDPVKQANEDFELEMDLQAGKPEAIKKYLQKNPSIIEEILGVKSEEMKELRNIVNERRSTRELKSWDDATTAFKEAHPDYAGSELTRDLIGYKLAELGLTEKPSLESLEQAYEAVKTRHPAVFQAQTQTTTTTEVKTDPAPKKKAESSALFGLNGGSDTRTTHADPSKVKINLTAEQFNSMNPEQLAAWYNSQISEITGQRAPGH